MEPLTLLLNAVIAGAAAALKPAAENAVKDTYNALKDIIKQRWNRIALDHIEGDPTSKVRQAALEEDLQKTEAFRDSEVLRQAQQVIAAVNRSDAGRAAAATAGISIEKLKAGASIHLEDLISADSVKVSDLKAKKNIRIKGVHSGNPPMQLAGLDPIPAAAANPMRDSSGFKNLRAGRDVNVYLQTDAYMIARGPEAHRAFTARPNEPWDSAILEKETIADLRVKLLHGNKQPRQPVPITVRGTLFPCALLSSGWWEKHAKANILRIRWRDEVQQWLFHGFDLWGPSWDFTWDFDNWEQSKERPYFIAQLGDGDEANSMPVLIPGSKAGLLQERLEGWGGIEADVTGILGHRTHFTQYFDPGVMELFGGLLDFCLWLDEEDKKHRISPRLVQTEVYSGYLWKCVAPSQWLQSGKPRLNDVYFVWEHTNFASRDAVAYCLEALNKKEEYILRKYKYNDLVLVQKSSSLVPGVPMLKPQDIYGMLIGKSGEAI